MLYRGAVMIVRDFIQKTLLQRLGKVGKIEEKYKEGLLGYC
jgi:hypothetical protein